MLVLQAETTELLHKPVSGLAYLVVRVDIALDVDGLGLEDDPQNVALVSGIDAFDDARRLGDCIGLRLGHQLGEITLTDGVVRAEQAYPPDKPRLALGERQFARSSA